MGQNFDHGEPFVVHLRLKGLPDGLLCLLDVLGRMHARPRQERRAVQGREELAHLERGAVRNDISPLRGGRRSPSLPTR